MTKLTTNNMKKNRNNHLLRNTSDEAWSRFTKQAKARGMTQGHYFDQLMGVDNI